jgi:methylated-DNA-[protein]-cysteine S-methyltransferase
MTMQIVRVNVASPVGEWGIEGTVHGVTMVRMPHQSAPPTDGPVPRAVSAAARQLAQYFAGKRIAFDVHFADVAATAFQLDCWEALRDIPFGHVATYADIGAAIGRPLAARAVGNANHANPWPILVPCHRVVASTGLGGYGGGLDVKRYLLALEGVTYAK